MFEDWIELCALFAKHKVRYLIIGGNAVIFRGYERYTKDLDIWIEPTKANARRAFAAAKEFGTIPASVNIDDFVDPNVFVVMGAEPYRVVMKRAAKRREGHPALRNARDRKAY